MNKLLGVTSWACFGLSLTDIEQIGRIVLLLIGIVTGLIGLWRMLKRPEAK